MFARVRRHPPVAGGLIPMTQLAYSIKETAKTLSLGRTSIYVLINDGRLEVFKLGRRTLVKAESIQRLIDEQR
jgi:excisionase family DNA binding protein